MSGVISKVSNTLYGQKAPRTYNVDEAYGDQTRAAELQTKYGMLGVDSPLGKTDVVQTADGTFERTFEQSQADETRNKLINQGLSGVSLDPTRAEDAYYDRATRLLTPQFDRQTERMDENLINRGIGVGNEQYNQQMGDLQDRQQGTLSDLANQAVFAGQDLAGSQIANTNQLAGGRDIMSLASLATPTGANFSGVYDKYLDAYNNKVGWQNQQNRKFMEGVYGGMGSGGGA